MPRLALGAFVLLWAAAASGQRVPGRDLLTYPLGLTGEGAALGSGPASGLWNPASGVLEPGERGRVGVAALSAPIDLGLSGQVFHGAILWRGVGTVTGSITHAAVTDLLRTDTDPQSIGGEIPYSTFVISLGVARRLRPHIVAGGALRWHTGRFEGAHGSTMATDAGIVIDHLTSRDARIGVSTFLWTFDASDAPVVAVTGDVRVVGPDTLLEARVGAGYVRTRGASTEYYPFVDGRVGKLNVRGGPVRIDAFGSMTWRLRIAVAVRHAGYTFGIVREDNASGLSPTYQLAIANVLR